MTASILSSGRFTASTADRTEYPRIQRRRRPVIVMPGGGDTAANRFGDFDHVGQAIVAAGFRCYQPSVPNMLGNDLSVQRITDAVTFAHANGCEGPPILVGQSNGAACAFRWARENEAAGIVAMIAPLDAQAIYDADEFGLRSDYEAAFGITYPEPVPTVANPVAGLTGDGYGCPIQVWYASDDELSTLGDAIDKFTATGSDMHDVGALGHTAEAVEAVAAADVVAFIHEAVG